MGLVVFSKQFRFPASSLGIRLSFPSLPHSLSHLRCPFFPTSLLPAPHYSQAIKSDILAPAITQTFVQFSQPIHPRSGDGDGEGKGKGTEGFLLLQRQRSNGIRISGDGLRGLVLFVFVYREEVSMCICIWRINHFEEGRWTGQSCCFWKGANVQGSNLVGVAKLCPNVRIQFCFICLITLLPFT